MIYLLHFSSPISSNHTTQHYVGWTNNVNERLQEHQNGNGARLTQVANERGIEYQVVKVWKGDRSTERKIKNLHSSNRLCPVCQDKPYSPKNLEEVKL